MGLRAVLGPQEEEETRKQLEAQKTLENLSATPAAPVKSPEQQEYEMLSKQAEEAIPTEQDVFMAGLRRTGAQLRAEAPAYLEKAAETAFYKPDYSQITKIAQTEAERPDMFLPAKEQAQKRLQVLAESARKRALLPGQMKEQESQIAMAQARMDALKEASALKAKANQPASMEQIEKFQSKFGKLGLALPESPTQGQLAEAYEGANKAMGDYIKATEVARIGAVSREKVAESKGELAEAGRAEKKAEKERELTVPGVGTALTKEDAKLLKTQAAAKKRIEGGLDRISKEYANLTDQEILKAPQTVQNIGTEAKDLIMAYKEYFRLGAPQSAELKFLYSMIGASPLEIGKTLVMDKTLGTNIQTKLNRLKSIANEAWQAEVNLRTRSQEAPAAAPASTKYGSEREEFEALKKKYGGKK